MNPTESHLIPARQIRAIFSEQTIRVYQAYPPAIAHRAVEAQTFVSPFKRDRMTWIKPSFYWMMYRCGWASKVDQEHVLAIDITRQGFEWALEHACMSSFRASGMSDMDEWKRALRASPVRIQWDPERDISQVEQDYRSIQIGLSGKAVHAYVDSWIVHIEDVSEQAKQMHSLVQRLQFDEARQLAPVEAPYPLSEELAKRIGVLEQRFKPFYLQPLPCRKVAYSHGNLANFSKIYESQIGTRF
jgi:hypothetical protein